MVLQSCILSNYELAESILFKILEKYRIKQNREFFKCDITIIRQTFEQIEKMFKDHQDIIYIHSVLNCIKIDLIALIKNKFKHALEHYLEILENDADNLYDSKLLYLKTSEDELSEDSQLYNIINDDNIFTGCVRSLLLYYKDEDINNKILWNT